MLRNSVPAGLVCAKNIDSNTVFVNLDYVIPGYRDFKIGKYVYRKFFRENIIRKIFTYPGNKTHNKYLRKMGFQKTTFNSQEAFLLELS